MIPLNERINARGRVSEKRRRRILADLEPELIQVCEEIDDLYLNIVSGLDMFKDKKALLKFQALQSKSHRLILKFRGTP